MADITAALVKELREKSGAGMMDCKKALTETGGDIEAGMDWLRTKGLSKAAKKADRVAAEGLIAIALRTDGAGMTGVAVEVNAETDFVAATRSSRPPPAPWPRPRSTSKAAWTSSPRPRPRAARR